MSTSDKASNTGSEPKLETRIGIMTPSYFAFVVAVIGCCVYVFIRADSLTFLAIIIAYCFALRWVDRNTGIEEQSAATAQGTPKIVRHVLTKQLFAMQLLIAAALVWAGLILIRAPQDLALLGAFNELYPYRNYFLLVAALLLFVFTALIIFAPSIAFSVVETDFSESKLHLRAMRDTAFRSVYDHYDPLPIEFEEGEYDSITRQIASGQSSQKAEDEITDEDSEYARPSGRAKEEDSLGEASNLSQTDHQDPSLKGGVKQDKEET